MTEMPEKNAGAHEASFSQFVGGFAFQTLVHLGKTPNPMTGETGVDLPNAKYSIDLLGVLQEKTKGNLTPEEEEQLASMLRDLRMEFVNASKKAES
jgi:hypothetical protein